MGWYGVHREPGLSHLEFFRDVEGWKDLRALTSVGTVLYGAYEYDGRVKGLVILTHRSRDWFNFTYKEMSDSMGPGFYDCPAKILDMLDPTDDKDANEWRAKCRDNLAKRAARTRLTKGVRVRFSAPIRFTNGYEGDTFEFVGRTTFRTSNLFGMRYRISDWAKREYTVLPASA